MLPYPLGCSLLPVIIVPLVASHKIDGQREQREEQPRDDERHDDSFNMWKKLLGAARCRERSLYPDGKFDDAFREPADKNWKQRKKEANVRQSYGIASESRR